MASQKQQYTILYGRLSQEDERAGESNSIQHQRDLLEKYARDKGFENTLFLADDGYSGTNFERQQAHRAADQDPQRKHREQIAQPRNGLKL